MPTGKICGNCISFVRIKDWGNDRNGLCSVFDYNCCTDSSYAKTCKKYKAKRYKRHNRKLKDNK